jgi:dipeptidyl aminopeptidase/acylaminoacyl peptidase
MPPNLPEGAKPPLIVYPHGGPELRDMMTFHPVVQFLATRGYAVFQPNFRGSSGYGKAFIDAGNRQFGGTMQTDIADGVYQLIDEKRVDSARICILGESYGGYAALMGVVNYPHLYRCAVSSAGVTDLYRQVRWERDEEGANSEAYKYWVAKIGDPDRDMAAMKAASPLYNIAEIKVPILLMHGTDDQTVPFEQSDIMQKALKSSGRDQKIVVFQDAGHNLFSSNLEDYLKQLEEFFAKNLPPGAPETAPR